MSTATDSVIHDLGYRRYRGRRHGRSYATGALFGHALRAAFGLGHGLKAKIFPWSAAGLIGLVAAGVTLAITISGERALTYPQLCDSVSALTVLFVASAGSELLSRDLGAGILPLYFSRPLHRDDYGLAKLGAMITATFAVLAVPLSLMFAGTAFSIRDTASGVLAEFGLLLQGLFHAALHALVLGSIGALVAACCRRRVFAAVAIAGTFLVSASISGVVSLFGRSASTLAGLVSPQLTLVGVRDWVFDSGDKVGSFGPLYAVMTVLLVLLATGGVIVRYRRVRA